MEEGRFTGRVSRLLRRLSRVNAVVVMAVGLSVLAAWLLDYEPLKGLASGLPTMKANTALCFILSGGVLLMAGIERPSPALRRFSVSCAGLVLALGVLTLVEYLLGANLGLDDLLVTDRAYGVELGYPGRMSPNTALCFVVLAAALLCVEMKTRVMGWPSQYLAALVSLLALVGVGGYLYGQREFTGITRYTQMAVHTTGCFLLLAFGVFLVQAERGFMQVISSPGPGGVLARRLLPPALAFPLLLGGLGLWAYHAGALPLPFAQSLIAVGNILLFTVLVWGTAFALDRVEVDRRRIDEERMGLATRERAAREEAAAQQRERSRAEAEQGRLAVLSRRLAEREQLLRLMVESADLSTWSMDCRTRLITADARFLDFQGLDPSGPVPLSAVLERIHPGDRTGTERAIEAALAGESGGRLLAESRVLGPSGAYRWGEMRAQVTFTPEGTPLTIQGVSFDVTGRKEAEALREEALQRIRTESERQRLMFEQAPASIAVLEGPEHRFRIANTSYIQLVGGRQVLGQTVAAALPEVVEQGFIALLDTVRRTGEPYVGRETWLQLRRRPEGPLEDACLNFIYQPIRDAAGQVDTLFVHAVEVTDLVRAREQSKALAQAERHRAEFAQQLIGIVSHDLRNPLSAISLGAATLQRREALDPKSARTLARIQSATDRAERMVRDLLDFTQVRLAGGLKLERRPADLHELARSVVQEVEEARPGARIRHEVRGEAKGAWDSDRIQQVVQNLLTNALKYGTPGEVVDVFTTGDGDTVTLGVHNQGEPIPSERQASIFQPMQRGVEGVDKEGRSVGLGLFIVRAIVEAHGGTIELTSQEAEGTTFRVVLPREALPPSAETRDAMSHGE